MQHLLLDPQQITLLAEPISSSASGSSSGADTMMQDKFTLTGGSTEVNSTEPHVVILSLTDADTNAIKFNNMLAISRTTTYTAITELTVPDYSGNQVVAIGEQAPLITSLFLPDITPPLLERVELDMNEGVLTLSFTEVVNIDTLNVSGLTLQSAQGDSPLQQYTPQSGNGSYTTLTNVQVTLSAQDLNAIKKLTSLATNMSNTYVSITPLFISDMVGIPVRAISAPTALQVFSYTRDATPPLLICFSLNLTSEILSLTFSETVDASTVNPTLITLQSDLTSTPTSVTLSGGTVSPDDSTIIDITLSQYDLHRIKWEDNLATELNNTCISVSSATVYDLSQPAEAIVATRLCAKSFSSDAVAPRLQSFSVFLNHSQLILNFDEPVETSSINLTLITLQNTSNFSSAGAESFTLTGGNITRTSLLQFVVTVSNDDLNEIKKMLNLLRDRESTFIRIPADFATDLNNNSIVAIPPTAALEAAVFYDDDGRPILEGFDLDMDSGTLTLSFSETVDINSVDLTGIGLQLMSTVNLSMPELRYQLMAGRLLTTSNSPTVMLLLNNSDLNVLKTRQIGRTDSVWITVEESTVRDIVGLPVQVVNQANSIRLSDYTPDTSPPQLLSFRINMDASSITLSFNETVDASTLQAGEITITAGFNITSGNLSYTLTANSVTSSSNQPEIVINVDNDDLNELKRRPGLATSIEDTYIRLTGRTINDTFGNMVVEQEAIQAADYSRDATGPVLNSFTLDMNTGTLTLSFFETVNSSSLNTAGITLYNRMAGASEQFTLSMSYVSVSDPAPQIAVMLTNDDLNAIKLLEQLATSMNDTFLAIMPAAIRDMDGNSAQPSSIIPASGFQQDLTPPDLVSFTIDMDSGQLILNFTESVLRSSVKLDYYAVRSNETLPFVPETVDRQHRLTGGTVLTPSGPSLTLEITERDLNEIKRKDVCTIQLREEDCYLAIRTGGLTDMNNNDIQGCREV